MVRDQKLFCTFLAGLWPVSESWCQPSQRRPQSLEQSPFHTSSHRRLALHKPSLTHLVNTWAVHRSPFMCFFRRVCILIPASSRSPALPGHSSPSPGFYPMSLDWSRPANIYWYHVSGTVWDPWEQQNWMRTGLCSGRRGWGNPMTSCVEEEAGCEETHKGKKVWTKGKMRRGSSREGRWCLPGIEERGMVKKELRGNRQTAKAFSL